ncbi:MAG: S-adenosylmethionine decarboxylase [Hyphomicrobium sp.]
MDLTRSSTAQKEDHSYDDACVAEGEPEMAQSSNVSRFEGRNLFIDMHGALRLTDAKSAERALKTGLDKLGKAPASVRISRLADGTLSGVAMLDGGHLSIKANPKSGFVAIDVAGCAGLDTHAALFALSDAFGAREAAIQKARCSDVVFLPAARQPVKSKTIRAKAQAKAA